MATTVTPTRHLYILSTHHPTTAHILSFKPKIYILAEYSYFIRGRFLQKFHKSECAGIFTTVFKSMEKSQKLLQKYLPCVNIT